MGIFGNTFGPLHLIVILVIILLLFGAPRLPALARSIGQSMKIFKSEIKSDPADKKDDGEINDSSEAPATKPKSEL